MNTEDRRLILAFFLSLLVFLGYQYYVSIVYPPKKPAPVQRTDPAGTTAVPSPTNTATPTAASAPVVTADATRTPADNKFAASPAEETRVLRNRELELVCSSQGASIRQITILGVPTLPHKDTRDVTLIDPRHTPWYSTTLPGVTGTAPHRLLSATDDRATFAFDMEDGTRQPIYSVEQTISLSGQKHEIVVETKIRNTSGRLLQYGSDSSNAVGFSMAPLPAKQSKTDLDIHELFVQLGSDVVLRQEEQPGFFSRVFSGGPQGPISKRETLEGALRWIALGDRYFTVVVVPDAPAARALFSMDGPALSAVVQHNPCTLQPGETRLFTQRLFAGPKIPEELRRYGKDILEIMNFGWFEWLGFWMLRLMNFFHDYMPNYGIAILLVTLIVRIVLYPLTYTSYVSMARLKELAPKMKQIQEKYKDNRDKLNRELMRMYKENKVNPAGGCLPILLQIPVFIAFYRMLQYAIELRGAPFLWIYDLAEKDPYYVLPILMGVSMLIQQKITPTPDPQQAKIGMIMTVAFTFLFLAFPSGLNLYWFASTVLGIVQQKMIERKMKPLPGVTVIDATFTEKKN